MDAEMRPLGLVSRHDALRWQQDDVPAELTIGDQTSDRSLPVVLPATTDDAVANLMISENCGRICVIDPEDGKLVGIVSRRDLLQSRAAVLHGERERSRARMGPRRFWQR